MAKQIVVDFTVKTGTATREVDDLKKEIKGLNKEVQNTNEQTEKGLKGIEKTSEKTAGGVRKIGGALKALGIGLIIAAFAKFTEVLNENQKVVDFFNTTFEVLSLAFNDFFNFVFDNVGGVVNAFKSIFEDPKQSLIDFANAFKKNIQERFESYLDTLGFLASAVKKVFSGDFKGALEDVKSAGKESIDVLTGVDNTFDKTVETVGKVTKATSDYVKETIKAGQANVELTKQAEIARVKNQGIIESFDLQAEKLRQVRDEERNTVEDRIEANDKLKLVLEEQKKLMLENADAILTAAQAQFDKNGNDANAIALQEAKNEKAAVEAQIAGFMSEQKSNDLALDRESIELTNSKLEAEANLSVEQKRFNAEQIEDNLQRLERQREIDEQEQELQTNRLQRIVDEAAQGTQAKIDAQIALDEFIEQSRQQNITRDKEIANEEQLILDARLQGQLGFAQAVGGIMSALGGLLQEGTAASKAAALAEILISTGVGFAQGLDIAQKTAKGTGPAAAFAFPIFYATQIAAVLSTVSKAKQILSQVKGGSGSGASVSSGGGVGSVGPQAPAFNIVGSDPQNQLAQTLATQTDKPVKAFVVSGDVTTAQSLDRNIIQESSLG
tara:strand:- start:39 stop:1877 length:1839 start_codon:yes stop_codon:yes gene_type:complete